MVWNPFAIIPKKSLGIDIGTSAIRIVELSKWRGRKKLEKYSELQAKTLFNKPFRTFEKSILSVAESDVSRAIQAMLKEADIKTKEVIFSIPDFSSFFTTFDVPAMSKDEIPQAVQYEARRHIPLSASEVALDWQIIGEASSEGKKKSLKILLVAVPNEVINQYQSIASMAQLKIKALEAEVFGLCRSLIKDKDELVVLVDIGARTTTVSIIDKGILKISHSFDISGNEFTGLLVKSLRVEYKEAERLKLEIGFTPSGHRIKEILSPLVDLILVEIEKITKAFYRDEGKKAQRLILAGSSALLPGLVDYFSKNLKIESGAEIANPFSDIFYPPVLEKTIKKMGPSYAVAVGMALRGVE